MTPSEIYYKRTSDFGNQADALQKRENRLSLARLITFVTALLLFFTLLSITTAGAIASLLICLIIFGVLIKYYSRTEKKKIFYRHLEKINRLEQQCIGGNYAEFADGAEYTDREHPNSHDLDLFGHASLFQYINRTASKPAADMMAAWLKAPASLHEIIQRQQAVNELKPLIEWRQNLITLGYINSNASKDPQELLDWVLGANYFNDPRKLKSITYVLSAFGILATTLIIILHLPFSVLLPVLVINFLFYFSQGKKINLLHNRVGKSSEMLGTYAEAIRMIEDGTFESPKLTGLRDIFVKNIPVSLRIRQLSKLVNRLDARLNIMVAIPLNMFFFWDIHCCLALEKWKTRHASEILGWFSAMAEFEVLSSMANMAFNNPEWTMPEVVDGYFILRAKNAGHPLIPEKRRINNTFEINEAGQVLLVTGSNMAGKSTFLRTCGINAVLSFAGAPVCADAFTISHVQVFSSMRISDSLEDNTSSFYAELKRLSAIIREAEHNPGVLLLLDEILRGTNSNDRYLGSMALIKQLIGYGAVSIVATHDLRLAELAKELPGKITNCHFDVKIEGEELYFDYKLTPGICTSLNASILMKKMGIRM